MKIIDIHTHGICGYDTSTTTEGDILKIAEIHGSCGVSEIVPAIYSAPKNIMRENIMMVKKAMEIRESGVRSQELGVKKLSILDSRPSTILGVHLEGPFLNPSRSGALDAASFIEPTEYSFKELIEGFEDMVKIITVAPEIKGAARLIKKMSDMGIIVSMGHSDATYAEAEAGFNAGARGITHIFNAMRGFHHREPGLAGFGLLNQDIYIEVIADPYHLHPKTLELIFKIKNHRRIIIISDTVKESKKEDARERKKGITNIHGKLSGGCMTVTESSKRLIEMGFNEGVIMRCITKNPERYLLENIN